MDDKKPGSEEGVKKVAVKEPSPLDLLRAAADALEERRGMRAKTYRLAAADVRAIAARLEKLV